MSESTFNTAGQSMNLESLEHRQLMSGSTLTSGTLKVVGMQWDKTSIKVSADSSKVHAVIDGKDTAFTLAGVKNIVIVGSTAADNIAVDPSVKVPVTVYNPDKYDTITGISDLKNNATLKSITAVQLINTDTGKPVAGYENMSGTVTLDLAKLPAHVTLAATLSSEGRVRFDYDGKTGYRVEDASPYAIAGDDNGGYRAFSLSAGTHTLTANVLSSNSVLASRTVTLKVINSQTSSTTNGKGSSPATTPTATPTVTPTPTPVVTPTPTPAPTPAPTPTPTVTPTPTPTVTPTPTPSATTDAKAPTSVITALSKTIPAGTAVHVDALASTLKSGDWNTGYYDWNFGDSGTAENVMRGFNAAHIYDKAGTYTVSLTVTNDQGKSSTTTMTLTVTPPNRQVIYISAQGSDSNSGLSSSSPLQSFAKAASLATSNTEFLFERGDTFNVSGTFKIDGTNVVIGAYGVGNRPKLMWTGARDTEDFFHLGTSASNVTIQNLSFDSIFNQDTNDGGMPIAITPGGTNFTGRGNEFLNLQSAFQLNQNPNGVLILNNTAPSQTGLRKYFAWVQGQHVTIAGNQAANSTREHIVRANYVAMMNVSDNDFTNLDRSAQGDQWDPSKTAMNIQSGTFAYAYNNKVHSEFSIGPLGETMGLTSKENRYKYVIADGNEVWDGQMLVNHGSEHVTLRNNVVHNDNKIGYNVDGFDTTYNRGVVDLVLQHNTATNTGTTGSFIEVFGSVAGIRMTDNLYLAPNLQVGIYGTAAVKIDNGAQASFTEIDGNVWPVAKSVLAWVGKPAINFDGAAYDQNGLKTADEWNALGFVGTDTFQNATPTDSYSMTLNGVQVGAKLAA